MGAEGDAVEVVLRQSLLLRLHLVIGGGMKQQWWVGVGEKVVEGGGWKVVV